MQSLLAFKFTVCLDASLRIENLTLVLRLVYTFITINTQNQCSFRKHNFKMEQGVQAPVFLFFGFGEYLEQKKNGLQFPKPNVTCCVSKDIFLS